MNFKLTTEDGVSYFWVNDCKIAYQSKETNYHWWIMDNIRHHMIHGPENNEGEYLNLSTKVGDAAEFLTRVASWLSIYSDMIPAETYIL